MQMLLVLCLLASFAMQIWLLAKLANKSDQAPNTDGWTNNAGQFRQALKYIKGILSPYAVWHSYFSIPRQPFYRKRAKSLEETFSSSENASWLILLKYQKTDVQMQASLTKIETSYIAAFLNGTNCRFVEYKY